jgi:hypothetical protein
MSVWIGPAAMASVSVAGLVGALLIEGPIGDGLGVIGLGIPSLLLLVFLFRGR